ncbi:FtsW/RodA/SpoVE family cell cycle protein [Clostridium sp. M62/1]|uniref:FtsW/RodA/SpoVE family cell cycle protein n=1 Tax=Clostridium sp. M62/1 TaxID=411486 RepID=UPI00019737B7|nr:FtsW/RodA/SpoVE family cell cycle protein [Clostridium sp. M62/1]EFE13222.1 cell cycle protein, FtsW/RodA/SpoVE family [Clostridium sp. M62/1]UEB77776.1 FtsW/RodA/SpoVE family cell cycle protein [Clostridium sp. M62/1]
MANLITNVSKYLMILLIAIYTYYNFRFFGVGDEDQKRHLCRLQNVILVLIHTLAYTIIYLRTEDEKALMFFGAQLLFFFLYMGLYRLFYHNLSRLLLNNACMLLSTSFIIMTRLSMDRAVRQFAIVVAAAAVTMIIPFIMDRAWQLSKIPWVYGSIGLLLLLVVCVMGNTAFGAQLSITIGGFSFQPSEFVKISFVFFVATMFYRSTDFKTVVITTAAAAAHVLVLVLSKDLGSALIFFVTYLLMLFVATNNWLYLGLGAGCGSAAAVFAYQMFSHVRTRVEAWLDPWSDIAGKGYQISQSLFAIGTGGWFGMGLYQGMPSKIPVVEKDFIFSAISEELGGIYALCLILICLGCFMQFMLIAVRMQAMFYKLIAFGLGTAYIVQVFLTIGGVTKFIPSTGVTLPFVSYGGSSIFSTFIVFNVVQGLYILKRNEEEEEYEAE